MSPARSQPRDRDGPAGSGDDPAAFRADSASPGQGASSSHAPGASLPHASGAPAATARTERRAAWIAVATALVLTAVKIVAWRMTGSSVIFSDALEGVVNVVASFVALWAIHHAHRPADRTHPYGHGRFELLSAAFEGGMIFIASIVILWRAIESLLSGDIHLESLDAGIALLLLTIMANGAVGGWLLSMGRRGGSPALTADGKHLLSDALTTLVAIVSLGFVRMTGWAWVDPVAAIGLGAAIGVVGWRVVRRSLGDLVDEQDLRDAQRVEAILESHCGAEGREPAICSWHALRVRHVGREHWAEFHMQVPASMDVRRAHDAASSIEHEIETALGPGNATAHIEPCRDAACPRCAGGRA